MLGRLLSRLFGTGARQQPDAAPAAERPHGAVTPPGAAASPPTRAETAVAAPPRAAAPAADATANAFKSLLLRELFGEAGLAQELTSGCRPAGPVRPAVRSLAARWGAEPEQADLLLRQAAGGRADERPLADRLAALRAAAHDYRTRCRAALGAAVLGRRDEARGLLREAAAVDDSWARHHHLAGLLAGLEGDGSRALAELTRARDAEPFEEARRRITEAIDLVNGLQWGGGRRAELPGTAAAALSEEVRQSAALLAER
jgi:hypothetical protein